MGQDMVERTNRRDLIIEEASRLFVEQGYAETSVRQIAEAVGCTEAALYYHFRDGKRELLQAVVEATIPDLMNAVEECHTARNLHDLVALFVRGILNNARKQRISQMRWMMAEFPNLSDDERDLFYKKHLLFRTSLRGEIQRFVPDEAEANRVAWLLVFVSFGYGQLMINLDLQSFVDFDLNAFIDFLANQIAARHE